MADAVFTGARARWLPLYEAFKAQVVQALGAFEEYAGTSAVTWRHDTSFAEISAKKDCMVVAFPSDTLHDEWEPAKVLQTSPKRVVHYFDVKDDALFPLLLKRIAAAYALTKPSRPRTVSEAPPESTTIDEYIAQFPENVQTILRKVRSTIHEAAPDATERICWQMPTFWQGGNLLHFAAMKKHIGIYPKASGVAAFADRLAQYKTSKGAIQFPLSQPIPFDLIGEIARFRVREEQGKIKDGEKDV